MSSRSITNLFNDLKSKFNFQYIYTRRLNQDVLEHLFCLIREMDGPYDHPCASAFKQRMKRVVIVSKHQCLISVANNTVLVGEDKVVVSGLKSLINLSSPLKNKPATNIELCDVESLLLSDEKIPDNEEDGFNYVLGYVVQKFSNKHKHLGGFAALDLTKDDSIAFKNRGGLMRIADKEKPKFEKLEMLFRNHYAEKKLKYEQNAITNLTNSALSVIALPKDVIEFYFRCRIYFRIRMLNKSTYVAKRESKKNNKQNRKKHLK